MRKSGLVALAAAVTIIWLGGALFPANAEAHTLAVTPAGKGVEETFGALAGGATTAGGPTARLTSGPTAVAGTYMVRTVWKDAPLPKVRVEWRRQMDDATPALSGDTIRFGTANFRPASGAYYLTADWRPDGNFKRPRRPGDRFAWLGANPLLVSSEVGGTITLTLEEVPARPSVPPAGSGIIGRVTLAGAPAADVGIYAYAKTDSGFKGNDFQATVRTNAKGKFTLELPPGRYYILARLRSDNGVELGPLHKGDLLGYDPGNPVVVEEGRYTASAIPATRLKMIKLVESPAFRPGTIEGQIVDQAGLPVPGAYAALYDNLRMVGRPVFRSEPAGADGRFQLSVPVPGHYFLGARNGYGGAPTTGGWFGAWDGAADHAISIKTGESRADVRIIVNRLSREAEASAQPQENHGAASR